MRLEKSFTLAAAMGLAMLPAAHADQDFKSGAGAKAAADLNFKITIPKFVFFRVGSAGATVDTITFAPTGQEVADGTASIAGTGGDLTSGKVTVKLASNGGQVSISEANNGGGNGLSSGVNNISYAQVNTTDSGGGGITPPALSDSGGNTSAPVAKGNVTSLTSTWTYTYDNPATPPQAGDYTGTVTYTAAIP